METVLCTPVVNEEDAAAADANPQQRLKCHICVMESSGPGYKKRVVPTKLGKSVVVASEKLAKNILLHKFYAKSACSFFMYL